MCEDEEILPKIDISEISLYKAMNNTIASLLKIRSNDTVSMYAAKLIESLQMEIDTLKTRLNYIQNPSGEMFIPPRGESLD